MLLLKTAMTEAVQNIRAMREADRSALRQEIQTAGGPTAWLRRRLPVVGSSCPQALTEDELVNGQTTAFYLDAEHRQRLCGRCPPEGGACIDENTSLLVPGKEPVWVPAPERDLPYRLTEQVCAKWPEYAERHRAMYYGVPRRAAGHRLSNFVAFEGDSNEPALTAVTELVSSRRGWLLLSGGPGTGKTHLAAGAVRHLSRRPRYEAYYRDTHELATALKAKFDARRRLDSDGDDDPLAELPDADFLALDNIELGDRRWLTKELEAVLRTRWNNERPTLLTSRGRLRELAKALPSLTGFDRVPEYVLAKTQS